MSNLLEFIVKMSDKMSSPLAQLGEKTRSTMTYMEKSVKQFQQQTNLAGKSINSLSTTIERLRSRRDAITILRSGDIVQVRAINSELHRLERQMNRLQTMNGSRLKTWGADALNQIPGAGVIGNPLVMGGAAIAGLLKFGSEQQQSRVKFQTLMGSQQGGDKMFGDMQQYAAKTTFRQNDVIAAGEQLLNRGVAKGEVLGRLSQLGDIAGDSAERLQSLALAFGQMTGAGHLKGQDLNQMIDAGFNPLMEISKKTGESYDSLTQKMEKGKISIQEVASALESATGPGGRYYQMQDKLSKTFGGKWSTFLDNFSITISKLGEKILPIAANALDKVNVAFQFVLDNSTEIAMGISLIGAAWVGMNLPMIGLQIGMLTGRIWAFTVALLANPMTWFAIALAAIVAILVALKNKFGSLQNAWEALVKIFWLSVDVIKNVFLDIGNAIVMGIEYGYYRAVAWLDKMMQKLKNVGSTAMYYLSFGKMGSDQWNTKETSIYDKLADNNRVQRTIQSAKYGAIEESAIGKIKGIWKTNNGYTAPKGAEAATGPGTPGSLSNSGVPGAAQSTSDAITGGGAKNIYINVGKFQDQTVLHTVNMKEGVHEIENLLEDMWLRLLNSANALQR